MAIEALTTLENKIFETGNEDFESLALSVFRYQFDHNSLYNQYCTLLHIKPPDVNNIAAIPYLPIPFFKSHQIKAGPFTEEAVFKSSGTTGSINSRHYIKDISIYEKSFTKAFRQFYGEEKDWCILGLLPSYLERGQSSLVFMVDHLIKNSHHPDSGFYLNDHKKLNSLILQNEKDKQPTLLIGVTYALLDFAEAFPANLKHTLVMETGGMKGRRHEMIRDEVHAILKDRLGLPAIHSEYGMTELLSQAYSKGNGLFTCPPWMKILLRDEDDPFNISPGILPGKMRSGGINVIDLANIYSCSFIATDDAGKLHPDGTFEVLGRMDNSDIRGCGLMIL